MITIIDSVMFEFNEHLCSMYNKDDNEEPKKFIHEKALLGLDWSQNLTSNNPITVAEIISVDAFI